MSTAPLTGSDLLKTPLYDLHLELGAKMVPFAGYQMPVQYPAGLMQEHKHTRLAAGLFDVSHMGQFSFRGTRAAEALERCIPADILGLGLHRQRYGLLTNETGGLLDDLMMVNRGVQEGNDLLMIVNGACKQSDLAHLLQHIGGECSLDYLADRALLALQGPKAAEALSRLCDAPSQLVFMQGGYFKIEGFDCYITRSGYTGEDGFEISVASAHAESLARLLLAQAEVLPVGLGARNSLRLEAGLCLYGNDLGPTTNPVNANLRWAIPKLRRAGGTRHGGYLGAAAIDQAFAQLARYEADPASQSDLGQAFTLRVGLIGLERVPVREPAPLLNEQGTSIGAVCSGLLSPLLDQTIAMAYLPLAHAQLGHTVFAAVRSRLVPMRVCATPFVPNRYVR
jgi:aminomethyltransferase